MSEASMTVRENRADQQYEIFVDGDLAGFAAYHDRPGNVRVFTHTKIDADYEGAGVGSTLARAALDDVRSKGMTIVPRCPFIAEYVRRHPAYADLVAPVAPERSPGR